MKFFTLQALVLAVGLSTVAFATPLAPLSSGSTSFLVNDTTRSSPIGTGVNNSATGGNSANAGQMYSLTAFGFQMLDVGDAVHDFGAFLGTNNPNSLVSNSIGGLGTSGPNTNFSTTSAGLTTIGGISAITTSGVFSGVFGNIAWTKTYRFIAADVIEEVYSVTNNGTAAVANFRGFTALDYDQYSGGNPVSGTNPSFGSTNTSGTLNGFRYAQSSFTGLNAVLASNDAAVNIGILANNYVNSDCLVALSGGPTGSCSPFPGNNDRALAYVFNIASLGVGASQSFTVYQLFGNGSFNLTNALSALPVVPVSSGGGIPEPGSMLLMGSACVALGVIARRRAKSNS